MPWPDSFNSFDIDGVIYMGPDKRGVYPGQRDIIVTGRSFEEEIETSRMLTARGIFNQVFYNPLKFDHKSRLTSGLHKGKVLGNLHDRGYKIDIHFEDDPLQSDAIKAMCPWLNVVLLKHNLTNKENQRQNGF